MAKKDRPHSRQQSSISTVSRDAASQAAAADETPRRIAAGKQSRRYPLIATSDATQSTDGVSAVQGTADDFPAALPGSSLGRYMVIGELGRGGMGVVVRAYDPKLQREVAVKCLRSQRMAESKQTRMIREAQAMAKLNHPNVVSVYDVDITNNQVLLAMEYIPGSDLKGWLKAETRQWREILRVYVEAGRGLAAAHSAGLLHRDFKPQNVLITEDGHAKVTDFGIARMDESADSKIESADWAQSTELTPAPEWEQTPLPASGLFTTPQSLSSSRSLKLTQMGQLLGTPAYMPPEQHRGEELTTAADQYAFCLSLWEGLTGRWPFASRKRGRSLAQLAARKQAGPPTWPKSASHVPSAIVTVLLRGLSPRAEDRWPSMEVLLAELSRDPYARRKRWLLTGALLFTTTAVLGGRAYLEHSRSSACISEGSRLRSVWNPQISQRVAQAFDQSDVVSAGEIWSRVSPHVDRYAEGWIAARQSVCIRTKVEHNLDSALLLKARACLDERRAALEALAKQWLQPNKTVILKAPLAARTLANVDGCTDERSLAFRPDPTGDQAAQMLTQHLRERLSVANMLLQTGQYDESYDTATNTLAAAQTVADPRLLAAARHSVGEALRRQGKYAEARKAFLQTFHEFEAAGDDLGALRAANSLTGVGRWLSLKDGELWYSIATSKAQRLRLPKDSPEVTAADQQIGVVYMEQTRYQEAVRAHRRALAALEPILGSDHPRVADMLNNTAGPLFELGRVDEATDAMLKALAIWENALGPDHPMVGKALNNIGYFYTGAGKYDEALAAVRRSLAIRKKTMGENHPRVAFAYTNLGHIYRSQQRYEEALAAYQKAMTIRRNALGRDHPHFAYTLHYMGMTRFGQGKYQQALALLHQALKIRERSLGNDNILVGETLHEIAATQIALGQRSQAQTTLERALRLRADAAPAALAETEFLLAQQLWPKDKKRAISLAESAAAHRAQAPPTIKRPSAQAIERWLSDRRAGGAN